MRELLISGVDIEVQGFDSAFPVVVNTGSFLDILESSNTSLGLIKQDKFVEELEISVTGTVETGIWSIPEDDEIFFRLHTQFADLSIQIFDEIPPIYIFNQTDRKVLNQSIFNDVVNVDFRFINPDDAFDITVTGTNDVIPVPPGHFILPLQLDIEGETRYADERYYYTTPEELIIEVLGQSPSVFTRTGYLGYAPAVISGYIDIRLIQDSLNSGNNIFGSYVYRYPNINEDGNAVPRQRQVWTI